MEGRDARIAALEAQIEALKTAIAAIEARMERK
jgi:hypothetical protein